ncbi:MULTISPECIES: glycosyltransferase [Bacteroides]|uniref:Glycosyltransferase n=2 Tax=Bacteroides acidifaciens TaxID=85831 RepID=A0A7K3MNG2_9BACE|nr:glycosyltransferase [Bacteroides acidifaciens]MBF0728254.1 glycosyltransferase [Bacteroides acidifaciens]MBF0835216.1 glycosyltransferase [Bacteroides acidifaciens]NDO55924.1 glycosyltransferase [Bacteroides acidifaciens]TFU52727.1 glycosyltransferase [Bacteroides acidifaciens]
MKILHVITSLYTGGAEKLMVDLLPRMQKKGHQVELCIFDGTRTPFFVQLENSGIKIHWFRKGGSVYNPLNVYRLWRLMCKGWDIVHTHNTAPQLFAAFGGVLCSVVLVTTEHNTSNRRRNWKWYAWFDRWMFRQYKEVICISDQAEINHRNHMSDNDNKNVCTIYNGIDYHKYANAAPAEDIRSLGEKIITNVAGFRYQKDQPTLIKAMKYLPDNYHLCLVGDGERRAEFEALIKEHRLEQRVHLSGLRSDVPEILAASDYIVMCSHFEGLSLSSLEGMASGKPFLADDVDGLREIVKGNGVLFGYKDAKGFADAVLKLDNDTTYRERIVKQCQAKAIRYDISVMTEKYLDVYKKVLG